MRKTKIVCTIGPACSDEATLREMCLAGMNVARLNFSHGTHAEHQVLIDLIKKVREKLNLPIAIMLDTKGPEIRTGTVVDNGTNGGKISINTDDIFLMTNDDCVCTEPVYENGEFLWKIKKRKAYLGFGLLLLL